MPSYTQANQPIEVTTPLGKDALLITSFRGEEGLSQLFHFHVDMVADSKKDIAFEKILGQKVTIRLTQASGKIRYFNGICNRISQGDIGADFTNYHLEIVPQFWLLTKRTNSRIFQQKSVPEILKKVLEGLDVVYQIDGTFQPRNYCVQYRESDFNFVSRLLEEEGIYYFFTHTADGHKLVLANTPTSHPEMPLNSKLSFERNVANSWQEDRILAWEKQQELVTGQHTIWDHKFEMHGKNLEAKKTLVDSIQVGKTTHKLKAGAAETREAYDYPGDYAHRFDGIDPGGGVQAAELKKILQDNERVVGIRSQQEAALSMRIDATTSCRNLYSGHKFTLQKHGSGDGDYVITSIQHHATTPIDYKSNSSENFRYMNTITVIPFALPFRPQRLTPKPFVQGTQTAIVVGPPGEEIFCDKYGRVKVQFHWDREGKYDAKSSCWVRVSTLWAGKAWGIVNVPRIGHEVIVGFVEGDPDLPIIMGSVFNADHMPPDELPKNKMVSGLKSNSTPGGGGYNGLVFNDTKGKEKISLHAQFDMDSVVEHDNTHLVNNDEHCTVIKHRTHTVNQSETIKVDNHRATTIKAGDEVSIEGGQQTTIKGGQKISIEGGLTLAVKGGVNTSIEGGQVMKITGDESREVSATHTTKVGTNQTLTVGGTQTINVTGSIEITSKASITLTVGGSSIKIEPDTVTITTANLKLGGSTGVEVKGGTIKAAADAIHEISGSSVKLN